jgi:hypothetical protein
MLHLSADGLADLCAVDAVHEFPFPALVGQSATRDARRSG